MELRYAALLMGGGSSGWVLRLKVLGVRAGLGWVGLVGWWVGLGFIKFVLSKG